MDRAKLAALAKKPNLAKALKAYFATPAGQAALASAPLIATSGVAHQMSADEAIAILLEEAAAMEHTP